MDKLYIFAIGGTGARVMKSLTMLMAAGELADYEVVPILIDFDINNGDLVQTLRLMHMYKEIHDKSYDMGTPTRNEGFFCSPLTTITSITSNHLPVGHNSFLMDMPFQHCHMHVRDLLNYNLLHGSEYPFRLLLDSLFTTDPNGEMNQDLSIGFKGNAKIAHLGYAALKIQDTIEFKMFLNNIVPNRDKVVVVGSTFGGTGSVGVLEILKQLKCTQHIAINNIATILIRPYFLSKPDPAIGVVDYQSVFTRRSKEFFKFYSDSGLENFVNTTYKIGIDGFVVFDNAIGGEKQRNIAHIVELLSAMAISEYAQTGQHGLFDYNLGRLNLQFGHDRIEEIDFYQFPDGMRVYELLTRYILSAKFYKDYFCGNTRITNSYFFREMQQRNMIERSYKDTLDRMFTESFHWIEELSYDHNNKYSLGLFDVNAPMDEIVIRHPYSNNRGGLFAHLFRRDIVYDYIDNMNAYWHTKRNETWFKNFSSEQTLIRLLSESSRNIFQQFIN